MKIITTHTNTDFDALASVVAATFLYRDAVGILPSHLAPGVRDFLSIHQDMFRVLPRKAIDQELVTSLVVVDTSNWGRLDNLGMLAEKENLDIELWDHHVKGGDIQAKTSCKGEVGAAVTLLLEEMEKRDSAFTPMHATLFLLGIYDDTGCLCFTSATHRDARMAAFLLKNGADLNIVSAYLSDTVDDVHEKVFQQMLDRGRFKNVDGRKVGICLQSVKSGMTMLANLVGKYREFKGLDAAIGIFAMDDGKSMVIGRSNPKEIDVGIVMRKLGGGGHSGAGSAVVKDQSPEALALRVEHLVREASCKYVDVATIMSKAEKFIADLELTMADAGRIMEERNVKALAVCGDHGFIGLLSGLDVEKAARKNRSLAPVKGYIRRQAPTISPGMNARQALELMSRSQDGILPVVKDSRVLGVLTRADILLEIYDI